MKIKTFLEDCLFLINPLYTLNKAISLSHTQKSLNLIEKMKHKKLNNVFLNETLCLALIKQNDEVALKLLQSFPQMDIDASLRETSLTQDHPLHIACRILPSYHKLISILLDKTQLINIKASSHFSKSEHFPNPLYTYLENANEGRKLNIEIIQAFLNKGSSLLGEKEILIKSQHYEKCNCLDLAVMSTNPEVVNLLLSTPLASIENLEHAKYIYNIKSLRHFSPEKDTQEVLNQLNEKLIEIEKKQIEMTLEQSISIKKNSQKYKL